MTNEAKSLALPACLAAFYVKERRTGLAAKALPSEGVGRNSKIEDVG